MTGRRRTECEAPRREHVGTHFADLLWVTVQPSFGSERLGVLAKDALVSIRSQAVHANDGALGDVFSTVSR